MKIKMISLGVAALFALPAYSAKIRGSRIGANAKSAGFFVEAYAAKGRVLFKSMKFDEQGKFVLDFPTDEPLVYWIDHIPVFVLANDDIELVLPERKNSTFVLGGSSVQKIATGSLETTAEIRIVGKTGLNHLLVNEINQSWTSFSKEKTGHATPADIDLNYATAAKMLGKSKNAAVNNVAEFYNQIHYLEAKLQYLRTNPKADLSGHYFDVLNKLSLNNPVLNSLKPIGIRALVANYYLFLKLSEGGKLTDEALTDNSSLARMQYLLKNVSNQRIINEELNQAIVYHLSAKGWNPELDKIMEATLEKTTDEDAKKNLVTMRANYSKVSKSARAPDFSIPDAAGKLVKLSDFKGKIVAIDVWATWCIPCMHSLPYFLALREKYKDNTAVVFLSVSIDNAASKSKWLTFLQSKQMNGVDLHAGDQRSSAFEKDYNITGIPRYILIDREGKIMEDHAVQASEPAFEALLKNALSAQ